MVVSVSGHVQKALALWGMGVPGEPASTSIFSDEEVLLLPGNAPVVSRVSGLQESLQQIKGTHYIIQVYGLDRGVRVASWNGEER